MTENCSLCNAIVVIKYNNKEHPQIIEDFTEFYGKYICKPCIEKIIERNIVVKKGRKNQILRYIVKNFSWSKGKDFISGKM